MKTSNFLYLFIISIAFFNCNSNQQKFPLPTNGETEVYLAGEENENHELKKHWKEAMHQAAPETNWRNIEAKYALQKQRNSIQNNNSNRFGDQEIIGEGLLFGTWYERGSSNLSGSVFDVEYDKKKDEFYLVSAGGSIFKGKRDGSNWQVVNDKIRFDHGILKFIPNGNGRRLLAISQKVPYFSDDDGITWTPSTGLSITTSFGRTFNPIVIEKDNTTSIYILSKPDYWDNLRLYKSSDLGASYQVVHTFSSYEEGKISLCSPHNTTDLYVLTDFNNFNLSQINTTTDQFTSISNLSDIKNEIDKVFLAGTFVNNKLTLLTYTTTNTVYKSTDGGISWKKNGKIPDTPWDVGIYVSKYNADKRFAGSIECYKTTSLPTIWEKINGWAEYYQNVEHKLHADIMAFHEFKTENGTPFILVSSHGGLSISYNNLQTNQNISLNGLNICQYYDVITDNITKPNEEIIYIGSQDQGFQIGTSNSTNEKDPIECVQNISGDYGHLVLTHNNSVIWKMYPGGWITATDDSGNSYAYEIESDNETVWIPPMVKVPNENAILVAGGSINGGSGSFIIKISMESLKNSNAIITELPFNFFSFTGSEISAIAISPINPNTIYVATNNSLFFYSHDGGQTFKQSLDPVPGSHYLYGSVILPSSIDTNVVYMAGSGYSNPPVFKSIDQGKTFERMDAGMPSTLVYDMAFNDDETLIFAGTESAPYVYDVSENKWHDMSGEKAPNQIYWSVEYLKNKQKVRFGTYGRGIWDFKIQEPVKTKDIVQKIAKLKIYPNPVQDIVNVTVGTLSGKSNWKIIDMNGQTVLDGQLNINQQKNISINLSKLVSGRYILTIQDEKQYLTAKLIKQ